MKKLRPERSTLCDHTHFPSVLMVAVGQVLFKLLGLRLHGSTQLFDLKTLGLAAVAFFIYFAASLLWVWLLRTVPLSRAYPFTAATLVLVLLFSVLLLRESVSLTYGLGSALVIVGVAIIALDQGRSCRILAAPAHGPWPGPAPKKKAA